jgi:diguanylate cyclase (GGDEF)-like protein
MGRVLIVDNHTTYAKAMKKALEESLSLSCDLAASMREADELMLKSSYDFFVVDLVLPDNSDRLIYKLSKKNETIIVVTDYEDQLARKKVIKMKVTDYIIKSDNLEFTYLINLFKRLMQNKNINVLVVDDSKLIRRRVVEQLSTQHLTSIEVENGEQAWDVITHQQIDLIITDYEMPHVNGLSLVQKVRERFTIDELPIIVLSSSNDDALIARFLKMGANDYVTKPFSAEEFICRINITLNNLDMIKKIKQLASHDQLTNLYNRSHFYIEGANIFERAKRSKKPLTLAMIDIDHFKKVNDFFGHVVGDKALVHITQLLRKALRRTDLAVRFGGEEFVVLMPDCSLEQSSNVLVRAKELVDKTPLVVDEKEIHMTISIGVSSLQESDKDLDILISRSDDLLYQAKEEGRNRVISA